MSPPAHPKTNNLSRGYSYYMCRRCDRGLLSLILGSLYPHLNIPELSCVKGSVSCWVSKGPCLPPS